MFWLRLGYYSREYLLLGIRIEWKWGEIGNTGPASSPHRFLFCTFSRWSEKRDRGDSFRWEYISRSVEYAQETTVGAKDFSICRN